MHVSTLWAFSWTRDVWLHARVVLPFIEHDHQRYGDDIDVLLKIASSATILQTA